MYLSLELDNLQEKELGRYMNSKYKNTLNTSFSKSKREGMHNKEALFTPGFKYRRFSEFGPSWFPF